MSFLKVRLSTCVPSCDMFIHTDGMKDGSMIEQYVLESDIFVAMITDDYLDYANCRRELVLSPTLLPIPTDG